MAFLKAADALEMAIGIETNGEAFYRAVAQKARSPQVSAMFVDLANQEIRHRATFKKLSESVRDQLLMSADEWDEYQNYLQATVSSALFEGPDKALAAAEQVVDEQEALRMAIGFEKETLLFFYSLRDVVSTGSQEMIRRIIDEERSHVKRLAGMLAQ